ncbi:MAG: hypothetical protein AAF497_11885 [Planctomycetota bacterium]
MPTDRTSAEAVVHAATLFHRGVICPSEAWRAIYDATDATDVVAILDGLGDVGRSLVSGIHRERPKSLKCLAESDTGFQAMLDWCTANTNG